MVFETVSFVETTRDGIFMSKSPDPLIVEDFLGVLVLMTDHLARRFEDLKFFVMVTKTGYDHFYHMLRSVMGRRMVGRMLTLENLSSFIMNLLGELIGLANERVHERKWESSGQFVYDGSQLLDIVVFI